MRPLPGPEPPNADEHYAWRRDFQRRLYAAGWAAPWVPFRRLVVGVGMVPRGEVGLIFADIGRRSGVLNEAVFGAVLLMVMATTFVAPPALKGLFGSSGERPTRARKK